MLHFGNYILGVFSIDAIIFFKQCVFGMALGHQCHDLLDAMWLGMALGHQVHVLEAILELLA